jgi:hypothetical protein
VRAVRKFHRQRPVKALANKIVREAVLNTGDDETSLEKAGLGQMDNLAARCCAFRLQDTSISDIDTARSVEKGRPAFSTRK